MSQATAPDTRRHVIEAFARVLRAETHNLVRWPELLAQQLCNELQFESPPVADLVVEQPLRPGAAARPWLHRRTPLAQATLTLPHGDWIRACALSPDGRLIVSGSDDRTLKVWDAENGEELHTLVGHGDPVLACTVSPDGRLIVSGSSDHTLKVWDSQSGEELRTLTGHGGGVGACAVDAEGRLVVSASSDGTLKIWDLESGQQLRTLTNLRQDGKGHSSITDCALSPDGRLAVSAGLHDLKVWQVDSGELLRTLPGHGGGVNACAVSPDGRLIVSGSWVQTIKVWDAQTGEELRELHVPGFGIETCAMSPDGRLVVAGGRGTVKVWDATSWEELRTFPGHGGLVYACAVSPDGGLIISAGADGTTKVWDVESRLVRGHAEAISACAAGPHGRFVASVSSNALKLWDFESGEELMTIAIGHPGSQGPCAVSADGQLVLLGRGAVLETRDANTGEHLRDVFIDGIGVRGCAISPDGRRVVASAGQRLKLLDLESGKEMRVLTGHVARVNACAVTPDGRLVVSASSDNTVKIWDFEQGCELRTLTGHAGGVDACAVSPDGRFIVSGSEDGTLRLWDTENGVPLRTLAGHAGGVAACAVAPDGACVISGSRDRTLRVWDTVSGAEAATIPLLAEVCSVALHPWRPLVAVGDRSGALTLVEITGVEYGPIIVTASDRGHGPMLRCPSCFEEFGIERERLGSAISCPIKCCDIRLWPNASVVGSSTNKPSTVRQAAVRSPSRDDRTVGLDTYAARSRVDFFDPVFDETEVDDWFGCTWRDRWALRRAEKERDRADACVFKRNYFRGKLYADLIRFITGVWMYQPWIPPETVKEMVVAFERRDPEETIRAFRASGRDIDDHSAADVRDLAAFLSVCANRGLGLVGFW